MKQMWHQLMVSDSHSPDPTEPPPSLRIFDQRALMRQLIKFKWSIIISSWCFIRKVTKKTRSWDTKWNTDHVIRCIDRMYCIRCIETVRPWPLWAPVVSLSFKKQEAAMPSRCLMRHRWSWGSVNKQQSADDQLTISCSRVQNRKQINMKTRWVSVRQTIYIHKQTRTNLSGSTWPLPLPMPPPFNYLVGVVKTPVAQRVFQNKTNVHHSRTVPVLSS